MEEEIYGQELSDLGVILKLQRDYCAQTYEIQRVFEAIIALARGKQEPITCEIKNGLLTSILNEYRKLNNRARKLEDKVKTYEQQN